MFIHVITKRILIVIGRCFLALSEVLFFPISVNRINLTQVRRFVAHKSIRQPA